MSDAKDKHEQLRRCAAKLLEWVDEKRYGVVEVHFQNGAITHLNEIRSIKLTEPLQ